MITLALLAVAMQSLPAPNLERWRPVGGDADGSFAVDPENIRRTGDEVTAPVRIDVTRGQRTGARIIGVMRYVYDCRAGTMRLEEGDLYDGEGRFVSVAPLEPAHRRDRPVPPGSPTAAVRDHLCGAPQ